MKRLTDHSLDNYNDPGCQNCSDYCWRCCKEDDAVDDCAQRLIYNRLAAYEDTGLSPEEIISAVDMAKIACALHELNAYKELGPISHLRELAQADKEGRCMVLDGKSKEKELIRKLMRLLYWLEDCIKKKDFSPFRIVAGAPENNYPFISAFQHIENEYELEIHLAGKDEEAEAALAGR